MLLIFLYNFHLLLFLLHQIWNHPDILNKVNKKVVDADLDLDEVEGSGKKKPGPKKKGTRTIVTTPYTSTPATSGSTTPSEAVPLTPTPSEKNIEGGKEKPATNKESDKSEKLEQSSTSDNKTEGGEKEGEKKDGLLPVDDIKNEPSPILDRAAQIETFEWADALLKDYVPGLLIHGSKMLILMSIITKCLSIGEKMLIFTQSLLTLNLIEEYLAKEVVPSTKNLASLQPEYWAKNQSYFRLDGSTSSTDREKMINMFNSPENDRVHVFLLSTRAGCLGINLIGANRVVVFDASWNPCHDSQAVCRVYRYGQVKHCHIYRLVMDNTMERKIYNRQVNKQGMSDRIVDEYGIKNQISEQERDLLHYEVGINILHS